jgi:CHRD domain
MRKLVSVMTTVVAVFAVAGMANAGEVFLAVLTGAEEVPPVQEETRGLARIVFSEDDTAVDFQLQVRAGEGITQAHIHCAPKGTNGPIAVFLAGLNAQGYNVDAIFPWVSGATLTDASVIPVANPACPIAINNLRDLAKAVRDGNAYVNVHSVAHPSGVIRGQLAPK